MKNIKMQFTAAVMNLIKKPVSMFEQEFPSEKFINALIKIGLLPQPELKPVPIRAQRPQKRL